MLCSPAEGEGQPKKAATTVLAIKSDEAWNPIPKEGEKRDRCQLPAHLHFKRTTLLIGRHPFLDKGMCDNTAMPESMAPQLHILYFSYRA